MSKKGRVTSMKEKRDRSPSLSQKLDTGQQWRCPEPPSTLERKKALASTESGKIPIYEKHTVCSIMYAQNNKKQYYSNKSKPSRGSLDKLVTHFKVMSTKTIPRPLVKLKSSLDIMEKNVKQTRQQVKDSESKTVVVEKKPRLSNALLLSKDDHNIVTHEKDNYNILTHEEENKTTQKHLDDEDNDLLHDDMEYGGKNGGDQNMSESDTCSQEYETIDECFYNEHIDCHDDEIHQQDHETDNTIYVASDQLPHPEVDQETQNEQATQEVDDDLRSKDKDLESDERNPKELETEEVPKEEDPASKVVIENRHVVTNGKKDTAAYKNVTEEAENELRELRRNKVKALVGAFENVISHESHVMPKRSFRFNKTITF
ncbi:putative calmodulin-binding domain containing protein [Tanacetum coccineum]